MHLRPACVGDERAVADVHVRSWQEAYVGLLPVLLLNALDPAQRASRYTFDAGDRSTILAIEDGGVCGFATHGAARDGDAAGCGELMSIYVDPACLGRGVGRTLIGDACARLSARSFTEAILWVLVGNDRATHFYERDGWHPDGSHRSIDIYGVTVDEIRYRRRLSSS